MNIRKRTIRRFVALSIGYMVALALIWLWYPKFVIYHNTAVLLVLVGFNSALLVSNILMDVRGTRMLAQASEYREQGITAWTYAMHCKVRTRPVGPDDSNIHEAFCGCGKSIGTFPLDDSEKLLKLSAEHMVDEAKIATESLMRSLANSRERLDEKLEEIRNEPRKMREEAKRNRAV